MYARYPRQQFARPQPAGRYFFQPSSHPMNAYSYQASPYYDQYNDMYDYAPSELEALEWEEQQLLEQQAALLAERKRVAAEKRRLQLEEQERRRREWEMEQAYLERRRQEQHAMKQQQIRQRQLAAQKEAQLESVLRELEYGNAATHCARPSRNCAQAQVPRASQRNNAKTSPSASASPVHPLSWLIQAFSPEVNQNAEPVRRESPSKPQATQSNSSTSASTSASSRASSSSSSKASNGEPKRNGLVDALQELRQRVSKANQHVSDLLSTHFDRLSLRQFGSIDNELMQILLALDNVTVETDSTRNERKTLVNETMSLMDQVDQYKDQFSRSSSEASDAHSNADTSSHTSSDEGEAHIDTMMAVDEDVEDIDADSNASDVESSSEPSTVQINVSSSPSVASKPIESNQAHEPAFESSNTESIQTSSESPMEGQHEEYANETSEASLISNEEPKEESNVLEGEADDEQVEWDEDDDHTEHLTPNVGDSIVKSSTNDAMQVDDSPNVAENHQATASSAPLDDPFGFHIIHEAAKKSPSNHSNNQSSDSIPIQIGNNKKSSVVIEVAPTSQ